MNEEPVGVDDPTVAVVEDNTYIAELFVAWLEPAYSVRVASDFASALAVLDESVDVALLDRQLPGASGDVVLEAIRESGLDCRVAMVTGVDPSVDVVEMGFDDYLCKPVTRDDLLDTVERLVAQVEYGERLQELYALASKKALLETHLSAAELAASDEYDRLVARYEALQSANSTVSDAFSERQFTSEFARLGSASD